MQAPKTDFPAILRVLVQHRVDFIVVAGAGAALHGAPISTIDLELVHSRTHENAQKLVGALNALEARSRTRGGGDRTPGISHLMSAGHQLLMTRFGPLDLLGSIGDEMGYEKLLGDSEVMSLGEEVDVRVLSLELLILTKEQAARGKDLAVLPILRQTLEERKKA